MSFCIWGPVRELLFQAIEYIFPFSSLHILRKAKSKQGTRREASSSLPVHHMDFYSAVRTVTDKVWELSAIYTQYFRSFLQAISGPWVSFTQAEWPHHLRKPSSQQQEVGWAPCVKGLTLLHQVHPRSSLGRCYQPKLVSYKTYHVYDGSKDKCVLRNLCALISLRKLNPLGLNPAAFRSNRRFLSAIFRTKPSLMFAAKSSVAFHSCWVTWKLSIMGNNWKM